MRRFVLALLAGAGLTAGLLVPAAPAAGAPTGDGSSPSDDAARGLVYRGLDRPDADSACVSGFELDSGNNRCTHGPDPAPPGVDVRAHRSLAALADEAPATAAAAGGTIQCIGDGTSGNRVQAVYAVASDRTDRFTTVSPYISQWAAATDGVFNASAAETGGVRHVRWVTNADCSLNVLRIVLSPSGDDSIDATENELAARGYTRSDRKYLLWMDANVYCGIAGIYGDDRPGQDNRNNAGRSAPALVARVDSGCWGRSTSVEAHELVHMLGGVQLSAPHSTVGFHCEDESDRMCYADDPSTVLSYVCPSSYEALLDCGHDDYFSTAPATGSYLATHWNVASSSFLSTVEDSPPPPDMTAPPAPTGLSAVPGDGRVSLSWSPSTAPDLAGYRVVRNGNVLATTGATSVLDTGLANGVAVVYGVSAFDTAGNHSGEVTAVATPLAPITTTAPAPIAPPPPIEPVVLSTGGYRLVGADGRSFGFGESGPLGSTGALPVDPAKPVVDAAATPDGSGAWSVTSAGLVYTIGPAPSLGSLAGARLNQPVVGIAATPSGKGYWMVATDGGIFAFGDAAFYGSTGAIRLNQPIVGMAATPSGKGYWLVASDGGIFAFGDARFFGSTGALKLNKPVVGMAATPWGQGYWLVASDGGIFAFGDAAFYGSTGAIKLNQPIVAMAGSGTGKGYRFVAADGGVFCFGDARFLGSAAAQGVTIAAMAGPAR
jgi:hypothetical protein